MMMLRTLLISLLALAPARADLRIPGCTAYGAPNFEAIRLSRERGVTNWTDPGQSVLWFGNIKMAGKLEAAVFIRLPKDAVTKLKLTVAGKSAEASLTGTGEAALVKFGTFEIAAAGYQKFALESLNAKGQAAGDIEALILDGPAAEGAHFNTSPRRNAASVHLFYPLPDKSEVTAFYNEVTAVEDPVYSYFSENFGGSNGHLLRKARFGNQWIQSKAGQWTELLKASFSHDGTGKGDRLDRFMGVADGQFFLSHGGFVDGFTKYGEVFARPGVGKAPEINLPKRP